ncbi:hypothetical protein ACJMK2_014634 [Sinanodonta woodiana]|uniref:Uncharacterized protein n=1 Tax=Sinanodonta woodiana TaxID=1069815 RepID=A0ABD3V425_SINWO
MKIVKYRTILIFICLITLVVLFLQMKYIYKKRKFDSYVIAWSTVMPVRNYVFSSDISLLNCVNRGCKNQPIVTLFTTFKTDYSVGSEKLFVFNNTLYNWQTFKPLAQLIVFTKTKTYATDQVNLSHWNLYPICSYYESGIPTIKEMHVHAKYLHNTPWHGYFNGDILLTDDFLETLEYISSVSYTFRNASILITGRRINVLNVTSEEVRSKNGIKESARSRGSLYGIDAEDYFITNSLFPWSKIPEFVIGRDGYDNWIVGHARCDLETVVIDATETITAVHQTTSKGGNKEGFTNADKMYNIELMQRLGLPKRFLQGLTTCAEWRTFRTIQSKRIELVKRDDLHKNCKCKKWNAL